MSEIVSEDAIQKAMERLDAREDLKPVDSEGPAPLPPELAEQERIEEAEALERVTPIGGEPEVAAPVPEAVTVFDMRLQLRQTHEGLEALVLAPDGTPLPLQALGNLFVACADVIYKTKGWSPSIWKQARNVLAASLEIRKQAEAAAILEAKKRAAMTDDPAPAPVVESAHGG